MIDDNTDEVIEAKRDLENSLHHVKCIVAQCLSNFVEDADEDWSNVFYFLGHQLSEEQEIAQEAFTAICFPGSKREKPPVVAYAYTRDMLETARELFDRGDLAGVARCADQIVKQLEIILKYCPPAGTPVEPAEAAQ
jgi:hypothetical protein